MDIYNTVTRYAKAFAIIPFLTASLSVSSIAHTISLSSVALADISVVDAASSEEAAHEALRIERAGKIDGYFAKREMPLEGTGMKMVLEAEKHGLDWRLIPGIAVRESTGGKFACKSKPNNPFGWGSCKIGFDSMDEAIETIALNLGGDNPNTASYYEGKTTEEILKAYNPPSIVPKYAPQVLSIMEMIEKGE